VDNEPTDGGDDLITGLDASLKVTSGHAWTMLLLKHDLDNFGPCSF